MCNITSAIQRVATSTGYWTVVTDRPMYWTVVTDRPMYWTVVLDRPMFISCIRVQVV